MEKRVGFIGLGIMGMPMACILIKAGFEVVVYNCTASEAEQMVSEGAKKADLPKDSPLLETSRQSTSISWLPEALNNRSKTARPIPSLDRARARI